MVFRSGRQMLIKSMRQVESDQYSQCASKLRSAITGAGIMSVIIPCFER